MPCWQNEPSGQIRQSSLCLLPICRLWVPAGQGNWVPYAVPGDATSRVISTRMSHGYNSINYEIILCKAVISPRFKKQNFSLLEGFCVADFWTTKLIYSFIQYKYFLYDVELMCTFRTVVSRAASTRRSSRPGQTVPALWARPTLTFSFLSTVTIESPHRTLVLGGEHGSRGTIMSSKAGEWWSLDPTSSW